MWYIKVARIQSVSVNKFHDVCVIYGEIQRGILNEAAEYAHLRLQPSDDNSGCSW